MFPLFKKNKKVSDSNSRVAETAATNKNLNKSTVTLVP